MIPQFIDKTKLPHKPGIYIYKNKAGEILYVGKAVDLYHRVASYFSGAISSYKTAHMVEQINSVETIVVESELEALILEANLIKKFLPPYNIRLTDDKDYLYIVVTKEEFPKVVTGRKKEIHSKNYALAYFGPFPSSTTVKTTLKNLRRVFPWCSNPPGPRNKTNRPCFYFHIRLCPGACVGAIIEEDYQEIIIRFIRFMSGQGKELMLELTEQMNRHAGKMEFEEAGRLKKTVTGIQYLLQPNRVSSYLENPNFLEDQNKKGLEELQKVLNLPELPERIECYDISNLQGKEATGSLVVLTNGEIDKSQYRKFKIRIAGKPNDYAMHAEMMGRRLGHPEWGVPQLILIDGGRGQVRAVKEEIDLRIKNYDLRKNKNVILSKAKNLSIGLRNNVSETSSEILRAKSPQDDTTTIKQFNNIPIYGIAKREEWLYPPEGEIIKLPKRSLALRLIQKIRDESHRFAISYHRKLRNKSFLPT
jgi:excinuclease ABC subunit C